MIEQLYSEPDKMPEQWLSLVHESIIRLDRFTEDDGTVNWYGIMVKYDIPSAQIAINLHQGLRQSIDRRIHDAHELGRANEMLGVVARVTRQLKADKRDRLVGGD